MALGLVATIPAPGGALGLSLLHWPLAGRPSMASDAQCYYFKPDPLYLSGWAVFPAVGSVPLCCVLLGQALAPGPNCGAFTLPPCPAMVLKLQNSVNLVPLAQQGCCSMLRSVSGSSVPPVLPAEAASPRGCGRGPGPTRWKDPPLGVRSDVCLMRDSTVWPSPRLGHGGPNSNTH